MADKRVITYNLCATYSLLCPFLIYALLFLNGTFGVSCSDGCTRPLGEISDIIRYVSMVMAILLGCIHLRLYQKYGLQNQNRAILFLFICNCISCFYVFVATINILVAIIYFGVPMTIVLILQFFLWWYVLLSEIFHKKGKIGIFIALAILVVIVGLRVLNELLKTPYWAS